MLLLSIHAGTHLAQARQQVRGCAKCIERDAYAQLNPLFLTAEHGVRRGSHATQGRRSCSGGSVSAVRRSKHACVAHVAAACATSACSAQGARACACRCLPSACADGAARLRVLASATCCLRDATERKRHGAHQLQRGETHRRLRHRDRAVHKAGASCGAALGAAAPAASRGGAQRLRSTQPRRQQRGRRAHMLLQHAGWRQRASVRARISMTKTFHAPLRTPRFLSISSQPLRASSAPSAPACRCCCALTGSGALGCARPGGRRAPWRAAGRSTFATPRRTAQACRSRPASRRAR